MGDRVVVVVDEMRNSDSEFLEVTRHVCVCLCV